MRKQNNYLATLREFLGFALNINAHSHGYVVDHDANWYTQKEYIRDILELEIGMLFDNFKKVEHYYTIMELLNDMDCIVNVLANYDYCDKYALNNMLPKRMHKASESDKVDFINDTIYHLIFD